MFGRTILEELNRWRQSSDRKPLVLRGARQVGKTTIVNLFAEGYPQYIYLNLERKEHGALFDRFDAVEDIVQAMFLQFNRSLTLLPDTLLFIDEIQESPKAVEMLRYFYEVYPQLHIIVAGSLLETLFDKGINFPVGRVEYMAVRPVTFAEFLSAIGEDMALQIYCQVPLPDYAHQHLLKLFHTYTLIGGMPEIVQKYADTRDLTALPRIYDLLLASYFSDAEKYADSQSQIRLIRHCIRAIFYEAGLRIRYQGFGSSSYSSREIAESLRILEQALLIHLVFPTTQVSAPFMPDMKRSPRLQVLDTGLLNYFAGLQTELFGTNDLNSNYKGRIAEHIVGQELLGADYSILSNLRFWVREKHQSDAEVDFLFAAKGQGGVIPIEVKSGASGKLRSLLQYIEMSDCQFAIRLYAGNIQMEEHRTPTGKPFKLLNLPYFLAGNLQQYIKYYT